MTVWADPKTNLPIQVKIVSRHKAEARGPFQERTAILNGFQWDVELDESLFSLTPPLGYGMRPTEKDLIEALRLSAELSGGVFPSRFTTKALTRLVLERTGKAAPPGSTYVTGHDKRITRSLDEASKTSYKALRRGATFAGLQVEANNDWHYAGASVKLGNKDVPVCWWRPAGSMKYRVVYGDLSIRDVDPRELPGPAATREAEPSADY